MAGQVVKPEKNSLASNYTEDSSGLKPEYVPFVDNSSSGKNTCGGIASALPKHPPEATAALRLCLFFCCCSCLLKEIISSFSA